MLSITEYPLSNTHKITTVILGQTRKSFSPGFSLWSNPPITLRVGNNRRILSANFYSMVIAITEPPPCCHHLRKAKAQIKLNLARDMKGNILDNTSVSTAKGRHRPAAEWGDYSRIKKHFPFLQCEAYCQLSTISI